MDDFNGNNPLSGTKTSNKKDNKLEDSLSQEELCICNNGTDTYLHPENGSWLAIGLTISNKHHLKDG